MKTSKTFEEKMSELLNDYRSIDDIISLHKRKLSLSDYRVIPDIFYKLKETKKVYTFISSVASYFKRFGFTVTMSNDNVNYIISE